MSNIEKVPSAMIRTYSVGYGKVRGDRLVDHSISIRPTRNRLVIAMAVSAWIIASLLASIGLLVDFAVRDSNSGVGYRDPLTVHIREGMVEKNSNVSTGNEAARSLPREQAVSADLAQVQREVESIDPPEPPAESQPVKDWYEIANHAAKASVDEYFRQEEIRSLMWRQTRSTMFQAGDDMVANDEDPVLSNIRFKRQSRVLGLGINIGSCFIGIPIAGVPVEERSTGITVFVCNRDSG